MARITITGNNRFMLPGTFTLDDILTFRGTAGDDALIAGGGEGVAIFTATAGDDLYGMSTRDSDESWPLTVVDYSAAPRAISANLDRRAGSQTFVDDHGESHTLRIVGVVTDGFGTTDSFAAVDSPGLENRTSIIEVYGSRFADRMVGGFDLYGGGGNDTLIDGRRAIGEAGNDRLQSLSDPAFLVGGSGDDVLRGSGYSDYRLIGGTGNDRILASGGNDGWVVGEAGNDTIDGGAGDDYIDGGKGSDLLISGTGSDVINPDVEFFQDSPNQTRDRPTDQIRVTAADIGDYTDVVLSRAFEADRDQIRFSAVAGYDWRVYQENRTINPATGLPLLSDDLADRVNTVLQVDQDRDGFGTAAVDQDDYFLVVVDADLAIGGGYLLT